MWFLDSKIQHNLTNVKMTHSKIQQLCRRYQHDPIVTRSLESLSKRFNQLRYQLLGNINAFKQATETVSDTFLSFLPWTKAYKLRPVSYTHLTLPTNREV